MPKVNKTRFAILGLLADGPRSGYDLKQEIDSSIRHFWNESYGQIYPTLRKLVAAGWATARDRRRPGRPPRHVYCITPAGRRALRRWLAEPVHPEPVRNELLLKLFFGKQAPLHITLSNLKTHRESIALRCQRYREIESNVRTEIGDDPQGAFYLLTVGLGVAVSQAVISWCDNALAALRKVERPRRRRKTGQPRNP